MNEPPQISLEEAKKRFDEGGALFWDIRDPASYEEAHIPGAIHVHDGNAPQLFEQTDKSKPLVIYCYHGNSSLGAAGYLVEQGFKNVASVRGGFEAWRQTYPYEGRRAPPPDFGGISNG